MTSKTKLETNMTEEGDTKGDDVGGLSVKKTMNNLPSKLQSSKLSFRKQLLTELNEIVKPDFKDSECNIPLESITKAICKILPHTVLPRYKDSASRRSVLKLIDTLAAGPCGAIVFHSLLGAMRDHFSGWADVNFKPSPSHAKTAVMALDWTFVIAEIGMKEGTWFVSSELKIFIDLQSILATVVYGSAVGNTCVGRLATRLTLMLHSMWKTQPTLFAGALQSLESSDKTLVYAAHFINWLIDTKGQNEQSFKKFGSSLKCQYIDILVKTILSAKSKTHSHIIQGIYPLLRRVNHDEFKEHLLPAILKAMLRNPEVIMGTMSYFLAGLKIDMSQYAEDLGKPFASQLHAKDDIIRDEAVAAVASLAKQCSDPEAINSLLSVIFGVLGGSEGKLSVNTHKISLLEAAGKLASNAVSSTSLVAPLGELATGYFIKVLEIEVHEGTLLVTLGSLSSWAEKYRDGNVPKALLDWIPKGLVLKSSTSSVRQAYLQCIQSAIDAAACAPSCLQLTPTLLKIVENCIKQSSQMPLVSEGAHAIGCLIRLSEVAPPEKADMYTEMFKTLNDSQVFVNDRFLASSSPATLSVLSSISEKMIGQMDDTKKNSSKWYLMMALALTCSDITTRKFAQTQLKKICTLQGSNSARRPIFALLQELEKFCFNTTQVNIASETCLEDKTGPPGGVNASGQLGSGLTPPLGALFDLKAAFVIAGLKAIVGTVCSLKYNSVEKTEVGLSLIMTCHHPAVISTYGRSLWCSLVKKGLELDPKKVINSEKNVISTIIPYISSSEWPLHIAGVLATKELAGNINPDVLVPVVVEMANKALNNKDVTQVSQLDYEIYLTPEGQLYDKSVMDNLVNEAASSQKAMNIKRENKAYSHKEQMEEVALRKEFEEKKRKDNKMVEPKLTSKQKEVLEAHLEKESVIRVRIREARDNTAPTIALLAATIDECPKAFAEALGGYPKPLLPSLIRGLKSPLLADSLIPIFRQLRHAAFDCSDGDDEDESLSQIVAATTLQVIGPASNNFELDNQSQSNKESLNSSLRDIVKKLHLYTVPQKSAGALLNTTENGVVPEENLACPLTTPAFNYCFTLMKAAVLQNKDNEFVLERVLQMISEHSLLRADCGGNEEMENDCLKSILEIDELHPKYLPRADMFRLLVDIVENTEGTRIQQVAVAALTDVAEASSGQVGCAVATKEEFDILLGGLQMEIVSVRDACLRGLLKMAEALVTEEWANKSQILTTVRRTLCQRVWIAKHDQDSSENAKFADKLWKRAQLADTIGSGQFLSNGVLSDVVHPVNCIRLASAESLAAILKSEEMLSNVATILESLLETYVDKLEMTPPVLDSFGRVIQSQIDHWEPRSGVAFALEKIAPYYGQSNSVTKTVTRVATFFVQQGLSDRSEIVRKNMLDAAVVTVNLHGKDSAEALLPVFEEFMENAPKSEIYDNVRQSVVVLMGSLAKHLDSSDPKVRPIMRQLIIALKTPSQQVQEAVANCLPPLVPAIKEEAPEIVSKLIATLLGDQVSYGERKGAAHGVAGIVKGLGILSLKQLDIMGKLTEAITDKKVANHREGALFAFEMLCNMLGRLFEPYIVHILPHLLLCFGDPIEHVRQAADDTSRAVMSKLSAHGVKLVLPALLNALEEDQWRTKCGSVELLGAMAYCAPKQLSSCLPSIVPKLIEVLGDSHHKVNNAGTQALKQIGKVIRNPEIQAIVPVLLRALQDPAKKTGICLHTLLDTKFVHFIDAPSLALIMPVVQRAFQDRSTETRKMAAQIIGNMYSLTDQKDLSPYLPGIIPGLKASLLDPVPEVRAVSARALGAMVKGMGESSFEELLPWLMATLTSETSSVDRSGAAQGLAEVVGGLGVEKMNALLPDILKTAERTDISPHVKDGYIMMFIYMPTVFPEEFKPYISQIISPILRALADENEFVRETAYKAGQRLVMTYADTAIMMLLPELERGLFDENWRIRHSSIQLLGDLLYKVSGVSGKMTTETAGEDDNFGTEHSQRVITRTLGQERRNRVLAGLYMGRSDVALMVRQAALHVWKVVVSNTPKTLREILPTLFNLLLGCLASNSYDKRQIAARTLGDLVKKLGERVLPEIIPILEQGLNSPQPEKRQGVCVGLSEIMISTSKDMVLSFVESLVPTVRKALCDESPEVRLAAAKTFESLHNTVGSRALDDILPKMLEQLTKSNSEAKGTEDEGEQIRENTLDGLRQVMAIKARAVLPYLVPQLIAPPVNMKAIATIVPVAGEALHRHLAKILPAVLQALADSQEDSIIETDLLDHAQTVVLSGKHKMFLAVIS